MGTNYYINGKACPTCGKQEREIIHIGKTSHGWKFLFSPAIKWDEVSDLKEHLESLIKDRVLVNKYNEVQEFQDFWDGVLSRQGMKSHVTPEYRDHFKTVVEYEFSTTEGFS